MVSSSPPIILEIEPTESLKNVELKEEFQPDESNQPEEEFPPVESEGLEYRENISYDSFSNNRYFSTDIDISDIRLSRAIGLKDEPSDSETEDNVVDDMGKERVVELDLNDIELHMDTNRTKHHKKSLSSRTYIDELFPDSSEGTIELPSETYYNYVRYVRESIEDYITTIAPDPTLEEENLERIRREEERCIDSFLKNSRGLNSMSQPSKFTDSNDERSPYMIQPSDSSESSHDDLEDYLNIEERKLSRNFTIISTSIGGERPPEAYDVTTSESDEFGVERDKTPTPLTRSPQDPNFSSPIKVEDKENLNNMNKVNHTPNISLNISFESKVDKLKLKEKTTPVTPKKVLEKFKEAITSPRGSSAKRKSKKDKKSPLIPETKKVSFNDVHEEHTYQVTPAPISRSPSPTVSPTNEEIGIGIQLPLLQSGLDVDFL